MKRDLTKLYDDLFLPVIICGFGEAFPLRYMNAKAALLLAPTYSVERLKGARDKGTLSGILRFPTQEEFSTFSKEAQSGLVNGYNTNVTTFDGQRLPVSISGNRYVDSEEDLLILYIVVNDQDENSVFSSRLSSIVNTTFLEKETSASISAMLALAGQQTGVSRVYVFEEISPITTRNTYEWCAPGIEPAIQGLQELDKADYNYDVIVNSGMYITEDVSTLPEGDREILEMQGIQALAIITIYDGGKPLGYVGFDDCNRKRSWSYHEIQFLKSISALLALLIKRRNDEETMSKSLDILQLISDNSEEIIYANDLEDYKLLFVSKSLADVLGKPAEELLGQVCYKALQRNMDGPCTMCPIPHIEWTPGEKRSKLYTWEHNNTLTEKTYIAKDNIVEWIDGRYVHVETAIDISERMEQEAKLKYLASTDVMTGILNREWGGKALQQKYDTRAGGSLAFVDLDGLKYTNDTFGHAAGDTLLLGMVEAIRAGLRPGEIFCRWGGDEFLVWLNTPEDEAHSRMGAMQDRLEEKNRNGEYPFKLSFSYGVIAFTDEGGQSFDALVTAADELMYENKMEKRGKAFRRRKTDNPNK